MEDRRVYSILAYLLFDLLWRLSCVGLLSCSLRVGRNPGKSDDVCDRHLHSWTWGFMNIFLMPIPVCPSSKFFLTNETIERPR